MKQADIYYQALLTRDHRFDGKFFVGVKTTGIYCRPICPAKPKKENVEFFSNGLAAERHGYRPCLRCRPESAPLSPAWIGKSSVVQRAIKILHSQESVLFDENRFADLFGVSARHLRRLFIEEIGKTPKQLSFEIRLNLARTLIVETELTITEIAFAASFKSIRRFNDAFKDRFKKTPSRIRRNRISDHDRLTISLSYRPPYDFEGLLNSYENHQIGNLESFENGKMHRVIQLNGKVGQIEISNNPQKSTLELRVDFPDSSQLHVIISRIRSMFDIDSDPAIIANSLETDSHIKTILKKYPGIRLPSGWDPFEIAVSTILGQLVSLERARTLVNDLIQLVGSDSNWMKDGKPIKMFPTPKQLATANLTKLKTTKIRKQTLILFAQAIVDKKLQLTPTQDVDAFKKSVSAIKGIGPWTANYMALKVLRDTDIFPETDLILARALEIHPSKSIMKMSPWRGYVASLFWRAYAADTLKKNKK